MNRIDSNNAQGRRERERRARQQEILKAAREIFAKKGYDDTTLGEIAHHAEYGKGTIYNYFTSKDELFYGIIEQIIDEIVDLARSAVSDTTGGAREKLAAYAKAMISYSHAHSDIFRLIMREATRMDSTEHQNRMKHIRKRIQKTWEIITGPLEEGISSRHLRSNDARQIAALFNAMLQFYCAGRFAAPGQFDSGETDKAVNLLITVFFDGIAEPKFKG